MFPIPCRRYNNLWYDNYHRKISPYPIDGFLNGNDVIPIVETHQWVNETFNINGIFIISIIIHIMVFVKNP